MPADALPSGSFNSFMPSILIYRHNDSRAYIRLPDSDDTPLFERSRRYIELPVKAAMYACYAAYTRLIAMMNSGLGALHVAPIIGCEDSGQSADIY